MHYLQLAQRIADDFAWSIENVIDDLMAVLTRHRWNPNMLTNEQLGIARFETIARAETLNEILGYRGGS